MQTDVSTPTKRGWLRATVVAPPDPKPIKWSAFVTELAKLLRADPETTPYDVALSQWYAVERAYRALREAWTGPRRVPRSKSARKRHDPTLTPWRVGYDAFLDYFWGARGDDGKRHGSADPKVVKIVSAYQRQWNYWRRRTAAYAKHKKAENARRNKLPHVKASKAAWAASEAGVAWRTKRNADNRAKRAAAKAAKLAAVEVVKDV